MNYKQDPSIQYLRDPTLVSITENKKTEKINEEFYLEKFDTFPGAEKSFFEKHEFKIQTLHNIFARNTNNNRRKSPSPSLDSKTSEYNNYRLDSETVSKNSNNSYIASASFDKILETSYDINDRHHHVQIESTSNFIDCNSDLSSSNLDEFHHIEKSLQHITKKSSDHDDNWEEKKTSWKTICPVKSLIGNDRTKRSLRKKMLSEHTEENLEFVSQCLKYSRTKSLEIRKIMAK
eukprot:Awhi_evm1s3892